jgi:hypothetical protein
MANDRMWIVCGICQTCEWIGKYYPSVNGVVETPDNIANFIDTHVMAHSQSDIRHRLYFVSEADMQNIAHTLKNGPTFFEHPPGTRRK